METKLPTIAELYEDNLDMAYKSEQLNLLLNTQPKSSWVKVHPYIKDYRYLPIDKVEFLLRKIFKQYRIEILSQGTAFNGVWVTVRVHYLNPSINEWSYYDGIGACQLQTRGGTSPADLININNGALSMAFPIAKTVAIKDACDHFGNLFGANLNRKDTIEYAPEKDILGLMDAGKISYIENLIRTSTFDHEQQEGMEVDLCNMTIAEGDVLIKKLMLNQQDKVKELGRYNQTELKTRE